MISTRKKTTSMTSKVMILASFPNDTMAGVEGCWGRRTMLLLSQRGGQIYREGYRMKK